MAYLVPDVIETVGLRAKSWNWRQQTKLPENAVGLPSVVPLGVPLALTVSLLTRMLANPVVVSAARRLRANLRPILVGTARRREGVLVRGVMLAVLVIVQHAFVVW